MLTYLVMSYVWGYGSFYEVFGYLLQGYVQVFWEGLHFLYRLQCAPE